MYRPRATYIDVHRVPFAVPSTLPDQENSPSYELESPQTARRQIGVVLGVYDDNERELDEHLP